MEVIPEVRQQLAEHNTLIVNAPTGAGKSTVMPLALLDEAWLGSQKILMLEPRRLAARTIAERMSSLLGEEVGQTIGYRIRFENRTGPNTRIEVVTEGILTRMLQNDNALEGVGAVIFDEFHERSIHADLALALCREAQQVLRDDLRIVVMSATLNLPELTTLLKAPSVTSEGRQYPVDIFYEAQLPDSSLLPELAAQTIAKAVDNHDGDTLVFLPGQGEILKCQGILNKTLLGFEIHALYGQLPPGKQYAAIMPSRHGKRKVVLATSIAETSLTIEGVKIVVDSGFGRTLRFDPKSGLSRLETVQIDQDSADQRAGRAGRLSAGVCYRMWTKATHARMAAHRQPEIADADLTSLVLDLANWGINDPEQLVWLTPPPKGAMYKAIETLEQLEAIEDGTITAHGKKMNALPCHPRIANMLLLAQDEGNLPLATDVAALLEERDPLPQGTGIDFNLRIEALRRQRLGQRKDKYLSIVERVAKSYRQLFNIEPNNEPVDPMDTGLAIAHAFPERIACARPGNNAQYQLANGHYAQAGHKDELAHQPWLAIAHMDARTGMGKIFTASPLDPKDLAPLVKTKTVVDWDVKKGVLIAADQMRIGAIILKSTPLNDPNPEVVVAAISKVIAKDGGHLLDFNKAVKQWQNRIISLAQWNPDQNWPDVTTANLLASNAEWLSPYLNEVRTKEDLKALNLAEILTYHLDFDQRQLLNQLAPTRLEVPSGSSIELDYQENASAPVLAVRLQECFGLAETPKVNEGKTPVLMHLLSPGYKPVQITGDLASFWNGTYYEVRKELKPRYPKHAWPDDPWNAEAVRGVKRRR